MNYEYPRDALLRLYAKSSTPPSEQATWTAVVDAVFYGSMLRDEGRETRVSVVYEAGGAEALAAVRDATAGDPAPDRAWDVTRLVRQDLTPDLLAKLAHGIEYGADVIVVGGTHPDLFVDGIARERPRSYGSRVVRISAPRAGSIVVDLQGEERWRYENGGEVFPTTDVLHQDGPVDWALAKIGRFKCDLTQNRPEWVVGALVRHMHATGRGGMLAILPVEPTAAELARVTYKLDDPHQLQAQLDASRRATRVEFITSKPALEASDVEELSDLMVKRQDAEAKARRVDETLSFLGRLSAIDGAILMGPSFATYGAGYKIASSSRPNVVHVRDIDAKIRVTTTLRHGARHAAAFAFAHDNPGGVAFVVSEDGPARCAMRMGDDVVCWRVRIPGT